MKEKFEYPPELNNHFLKAKKLEWFTIGYLITAAIVMIVVMGNSQTMKTAWFEDVLSLAPPISFLIASRFYLKRRNKEFPFGYHRVVSIAYLCSALSLFTVGIYLFADSTIKLLKAEHPSIGTIVIFGKQVWLGYVMMAALVYGSVPPIFLGIKKLPLAKELHEKNLYTDAQMNKADWMTGVAAIIGITGIGMGWWWSDALAAIIISFDIIHDGSRNLKHAVFDLMNQIPKTADNKKDDPLLKGIKNLLEKEKWIKEFKIRIREEGHIYFGEAFVIPVTEKDLLSRIESTVDKVTKLNWLIYEFNIIPVKSLENR